MITEIAVEPQGGYERKNLNELKTAINGNAPPNLNTDISIPFRLYMDESYTEKASKMEI